MEGRAALAAARSRVWRPVLLVAIVAFIAILPAAGCSSEPSKTAEPREAAKTVAPPKTPAMASRNDPLPPQVVDSGPAHRLHAPHGPVSSAASKTAPAAARPVPASFTDAPEGDGANRYRNPLRDGDDSLSPAGRPKAVPSGGSSLVPLPSRGKQENDAEAPFDPVQENGVFFKNWPKPKLAIVITGRQDGYLEPCGCAGLERMKGGLMRRGTFFHQLRRDWGWPVVAVDVGGLVKGFGPQTNLKFQTTVSAMQAIHYDAIALGKGELRLPTGELVSVAADAGGKQSPFISANVGLLGFDSGIPATHRIESAGGRKIGITAILGTSYQKEINNAEIAMSPPEDAIRKVLPELKKAGCDLLILLAHAGLKESGDLARKFPEFDIVVSGGGYGEPSIAPEKIPGEKTLLVDVGAKGMGAVVLGFYNEKPRMRYQCVLFDSRYRASRAIKEIFAAYQGQLKDIIKEKGLAGLGVNTAPYPQAELLGRFVGSAKCADCHEESYRVWKRSTHAGKQRGHAFAYAALEKADPPRNFDPECISCHVVGWHPTEHFPYQSGFVSKEKTPQLAGVGCESCHGAGEAHCKAEIKNDPVLQEKLRKAVTVTKAEAEKRLCITCHDGDNSPDFNFSTYWPKIEHHEK